MAKMIMAGHNYLLLTGLLVLVLIYVFTKRKNNSRKGQYKALRVLIVIISVIIILAVGLFPDLNSVASTGEFTYDAQAIELTDTNRIEEFRGDGSFRKLSVLVYYPRFGEEAVKAVPLIVFSHGGISTKTSNISLYAELASNGYIVVSIDHTYHALRTRIDGRNVFIDQEFFREINNEDSNADIQNSFEYYHKWMKLRMDDISFVIDTFINQPNDGNDKFYALIDKEKIGVAGHSLGGSAALGIARTRDDVKAVIAIESPYMADITGVSGQEFVWNTEPYNCAVMNIYSDNGWPLLMTDNKYAQNSRLYNDESTENHYIMGSNHFTLTDLVRKSPALCVLLGGAYSKSGYDTLALINQISLEFFNRYLKDY